MSIRFLNSPSECLHAWERHLWEANREYCPLCGSFRLVAARGRGRKGTTLTDAELEMMERDGRAFADGQNPIGVFARWTVALIAEVRRLRAFRYRVVEIATSDEYDVLGGWNAIAELLDEEPGE